MTDLKPTVFEFIVILLSTVQCKYLFTKQPTKFTIIRLQLEVSRQYLPVRKDFCSFWKKIHVKRNSMEMEVFGLVIRSCVQIIHRSALEVVLQALSVETD
jgi:hypothetical protein